MYKVCIVDENPLIRSVLKTVLSSNEFEVSEFCEISERCHDFLKSCRSGCQKSIPCYGMLILFNCERDSSGVEFLRFIDKYQCPCATSFKVLYTCEELKQEDIEKVKNLHVQIVEKHNPAVDLFQIIEKYKKWYDTEKSKFIK